jgi:hypothetical protein
MFTFVLLLTILTAEHKYSPPPCTVDLAYTRKIVKGMWILSSATIQEKLPKKHLKFKQAISHQ